MTSSVCCHCRDMAREKGWGGGAGKGSTARSVHKVSSRANSHEIVVREALHSLKGGMSRSLTSQTGNPASVLWVRHWI